MIKTSDLRKIFKKVEALRGVSIEVYSGEIVGLIGPNGAGKTTTLRIIAGLLKADGGRAEVLGVSVESRDFARVKKRVAYLPEEVLPYDNLSGREFIEFIHGLYGVDNVKEAVEISNLGARVNDKIKTYSRGMKQMLAIILAFMGDPELIILDEPTTGLDPLLRERFLSIVREEARKGKTVFLSSHVLSEVQKVADRVCLIRDGRIVALEDLHSLLGKSGKVVRAALSKPLSPEELMGVKGVVRVEVSGGEVTIVASGGYGEVLGILASHGIVDIAVRGMTLEELFMHFYER
ncbi:MAG: ABC transporter ATP-binding protein [Acidilobaceae archaeon]